MLRNASAVITGFGIWVAATATFAVISVWVWGHSPDRYLSIAFQVFMATTVAFLIAGMAKEKIAPMLSGRTFVLMLGTIVLLWVASSMISGVDMDFKAIALAANGAAITIAFRQV